MSEVSLYDISGDPVAYFADDGETIYTWDGEAVAYLDGENLFSWDGDHLGWFVDGVVL
jgi:hypothetical protein